MSRDPRTSGVFGRYLLLEQLGQGGMAQIWRAQLTGKERDGREVVVKTLHPRLLDQPIFGELFAAEARITRLLAHPGIVRIVDAGTVKGLPYLAMDPIDGWDLSAVHRALPSGRRLPVDVVLSIAIEMCRAVGYAHAWRDERGKNRPIVHGDLSPSNLMVRRDGGVTLIDFGVAHMDPRVARGRAHLVIGKSGYLAPELLDDAVADARSDVFSAGVVLHELLTGRHLFVVESERETLRRLTEAPIPPPSKACSRVTPALDAIVLRALSRDPERRFASANELADALEHLAEPPRGSRRRVAACLMHLFAGAPRSEEGSVTTPIAPFVPARLADLRAVQMPSEVREPSTATINERPRRPGPPPAAVPLHPRSTVSGVARALLAVAALVAALLVPLPNAPAARWPLVAVDLPATAPPIATVADETPSPSTPEAAPAPAPERAAVATASPSEEAVRHPSARARHHSRHNRLGQTVAIGRIVDPFRAR